MVKNDSDGQTLTGNDRFHGFSVDVIRALSAVLNFRYELYVVDNERSTRKTPSVEDKVVRELTEGVSMSLILPLIRSCPSIRSGSPVYWPNIIIWRQICNMKQWSVTSSA